MISPIGTFLSRMDATMLGSMDSIIVSMTSAVATPVALAAVVYYAVQGLKLANGDPSPLHNFVPQLIRVGVVIWLSSNLDAFNLWVRDVFFTGLPNALAAAVTNANGSPANNLTATAASFDSIWSQIWVIVGQVWMQVGWSGMGIVSAIAGLMAAVTGGGGLIVMAIIYLCARIILAVVVCLAPVLIACGLFEVTKPILERSIGKVVALIVLQAAGFIVLQMILLGDQRFMVEATNASLIALGNPSGGHTEELEILAALVVWFLAGAFAMWSVPRIAYSIGSGVALSSPSLLTMALLARSAGGGGGNDRAPSAPASGSAPLSLSLARPAVSGGDAPAALPPPPPPSIAHSTRR